MEKRGTREKVGRTHVPPGARIFGAPRITKTEWRRAAAQANAGSGGRAVWTDVGVS